MNVGRKGQPESADCDAHGGVPRGRPRRIAKSKVLIHDVCRQRHATQDECGQPPRELQRIGRRPPGKSAIQRRFTAEHTFREGGDYDVAFRLKQKSRIVGFSKSMVRVKSGLHEDDFGQ